MAKSVARGLIRLGALGAHLLRGLWVVYVRFPRLPATQRRATVQAWAAELVRRCGLRLEVRGQPALPPAGHGLLQVANHVSWLDISALHAVRFCCFVSKHEVAHWPVVGRLATAADTLYLQRSSKRDAHRVLHAMAERLGAGDVLTVFPEGTTSVGAEVLPFHSHLLQAAIGADALVQPVAIAYGDAHGAPSLAPSYVGEETLVESLWRTLCDEGLTVRIVFGAPQRADGRSRQQWAGDLRAAVQQLLAGSGAASGH